jgi:hypothetical protein
VVLERVLPDEERYSFSPNESHCNEEDAERVWPPRPDDVGPSKPAPHLSQRRKRSSCHLSQFTEARIIWERNELYALRQFNLLGRGLARACVADAPTEDNRRVEVPADLARKQDRCTVYGKAEPVRCGDLPKTCVCIDAETPLRIRRSVQEDQFL